MPPASCAAPACTTPPATRPRGPAAVPPATTGPCASTVSAGGGATLGLGRGESPKLVRRAGHRCDTSVTQRGALPFPLVHSEPFPGSSGREGIPDLCGTPRPQRCPRKAAGHTLPGGAGYRANAVELHMALGGRTRGSAAATSLAWAHLGQKGSLLLPAGLTEALLQSFTHPCSNELFPCQAVPRVSTERAAGSAATASTGPAVTPPPGAASVPRGCGASAVTQVPRSSCPSRGSRGAGTGAGALFHVSHRLQGRHLRRGLPAAL